MIVDCFGRRAGSAEFRSPVEPLPYLYDAGDGSGPAYVCFDESEKRAIHRITTGSDGVKKSGVRLRRMGRPGDLNVSAGERRQRQIGGDRMSYREFLNKLLIGGGSSSGGASSWDEITGKPSTFPPSAHTHAQADVTGLTDIAAKAHTHANKATLDKLAEADGKLTFDGAEIGGGGTVDESRLLPALDSVPVDRSGNPVVFKAVSEGMDEHTLLYCPFDADFNDHSSYARTVTHDTSRAGLSISLERNKFGTGSLQGTGYTTAGAVYVQMPTPIGAADFTIHKWIYVTSAADRFGIFSTYGEAGSGTGTPGYGVDGLACWIDTDGTLKLYKASAHFSSYWYDDDSGNKLAEAAMPSDYLNRWVHIAVARSGNIWMLFADGSLLNSNSKEFNAVQPYLRIGSADSKATAYGNIDEFIVLDYAKWITDFEPPTQPASEVTKSYEVSDKGAGTVDESRLLPENPANGDIPCFDATATIGGGNDAHTKILLHFDADEIKDEAAGNAAPVTITKKTGTITVVEGGKWGKCAKYVTGSMTVATNLDELNANNWVVSGWFNPDENNHGVSYPTWLSMDDSSTNGFGFDSTGRYGESDGPLFYMDTPPASGTWHWLAIVKYSGGLRFYLNGAFLNEIQHSSGRTSVQRLQSAVLPERTLQEARNARSADWSTRSACSTSLMMRSLSGPARALRYLMRLTPSRRRSENGASSISTCQILQLATC